MSSKDYKKPVLEKLLKKYHNRLARNINTGRRVILKPQEVYKNYTDNNADIRETQSLEDAVSTLKELGLVAVDYLKFSADVEKIYLCEENMDVVYGYLKEHYGVAPQSILSEKVKLLMQQYQSSGAVVQYYMEHIGMQIEDPRRQIDLSRIEANLQMLDFLEKNEEDLYVRELSMLVYGDSKWFEQNNYEEICAIIRGARSMPKEEAEENDEALAFYHVIPAEQEVMIKGDWKIVWDHYVLETGKLKGGVAISSGDIKDIREITVHAANLMTIENKTSYQRSNDAATAMMYLGGFASRPQIDFLRRVIADNPTIHYYHFGDIDVGGFLIHRHLCRATGRNFKLYCMGARELADDRFGKCLKGLTDHDLNRLQGLEQEEPYKDVVAYMREKRVKLEQEIVSYYFEVQR